MTLTASNTPRFIDPRPILDLAIATGGAVIAGVRPDQLTAATPCPEMNVRAMLSHLVGVLDRIAALGHGEDPFSVIETHAPDDDWSDAWAASGTQAVDAWRDDAVLERPMALPWIQGNTAEVLTSYFSELIVHTWDLAAATGQQPDWDDTVVDAALEARQILPAENRRALFEEISVAMGFDRSLSRSPRPSPCTPMHPPSTASSRGTAAIPVADPDAAFRKLLITAAVMKGFANCHRAHVAATSSAPKRDGRWLTRKAAGDRNAEEPARRPTPSRSRNQCCQMPMRCASSSRW